MFLCDDWQNSFVNTSWNPRRCYFVILQNRTTCLKRRFIKRYIHIVLFLNDSCIEKINSCSTKDKERNIGKLFCFWSYLHIVFVLKWYICFFSVINCLNYYKIYINRTKLNKTVNRMNTFLLDNSIFCLLSFMLVHHNISSCYCYIRVSSSFLSFFFLDLAFSF